MGERTTNVALKDATINRLRALMHYGQTYDNMISEILSMKGTISKDTLQRLESYRNNPRESIDDLVKAVLDELENNIKKISGGVIK